MMISKLTKTLDDQKEGLSIDSSLAKNTILIISILLIIFTIIYFTCFGCFLVLNNARTRIAQTVTLSSEGPASEMYPDSMGEYQLAGEEWSLGSGFINWYRHLDREDRFIMYNPLGNIQLKFSKYRIFHH